MSKRSGDKEMGGAEKIRLKKRKQLQADAAKCVKLTELFKGRGGGETTGESCTAAAAKDMTGGQWHTVKHQALSKLAV